MKRYDVDYQEEGQLIRKRNITMEELEEFIKTLDEGKMQKIYKGDSTLLVRSAKEEQER